MGAHKNRLDGETSPYLLQHAANPVHWQPWDAEALADAREQNRPILLSIGYSACHWCHVMAHESFEDQATADVINELFVAIKVDREERPDLDHVYQTAHRVLTQRPGGWPLTVFLTPDDHTPFFAGTYFPREPRFGMPGFKDVLQRIHGAWNNPNDQLKKQNAELHRVFGKLESEPASGDITLDDTLLLQTRRQLEADFDATNGGFGSAPKFPRPAAQTFMLRHARDHDDLPAGRMVTFTLEKMARGGICDQLGGGFYRYSVDARWEIPHFEKMLYDNGLLLSLYVDAWSLTREDLFARTIRELAGWIIRDMQAADGGYFSSLDADVDHEEGGSYIWSLDEIREALPDDFQRQLVERHYGLDDKPNFEDDWHLTVRRDIASLASESDQDADNIRHLVDAGRSRLLRLRDTRKQPDRDEKILTSWNALAISGMARAGRVFNEPAWVDSAHCAIDFIRDELWQDRRLLACHKDGRSRFPAYLDDYAFLGIALLEMLETRWISDDLQFATELADSLLRHFEDRERGGFYFTADDHEQLIQRPRPFGDDAMPSGNGIACRFLLRLGYLLGRLDYIDAAARALRAAWEPMKQMPAVHCSMMDALREYLQPVTQVVIRGDHRDMEEWVAAVREAGIRAQIFAVPGATEDLPEALQSKVAKDATVAYVCRGLQCSAAATSRDDLIRELRSGA